MLDNVVIILQGLPKTSDRLLDFIKEYKRQGFNNIVLSTYSPYITQEIKEILNNL